MQSKRSFLKLLSREASTLGRLTNQVPCFNMNHIKNMIDENRAYTAQKLSENALVQAYNRVYKPSHTIEFNRDGEVLLYSCDPLKESTIFFKYPYILYESLIPVCIYMWAMNPLDLDWYWNNINVVALNTLWIPRMWYFRSLQYKIHRIYLLRGGKVAKIQTCSLSGDRYVSWLENALVHPLTEDQKNFADRDNADFLNEEGQLKYELAVQLDHLQEMGTNSQDIVINFMKEGIVHQPELFEAVCKGYHVDTSNFVINTADNIRAFEGIHNV